MGLTNEDRQRVNQVYVPMMLETAQEFDAYPHGQHLRLAVQLIEKATDAWWGSDDLVISGDAMVKAIRDTKQMSGCRNDDSCGRE